MRILLLNQAFYPDVVATAQHAADLAARLVEYGHEVTAIASRRAYDQPRDRFPASETWAGVRIERIPILGLGKGAKWRRVVDFLSFFIGLIAKLAILPRFDAVVTLTTPPLIAFWAALFTRIRGGKLIYWVMDLNPDQAFAAGVVKPASLTGRVLEASLGFILRSSARIIVLDRFMRERIAARGVEPDRIDVTPPWSHDEAVRYDVAARREFRTAHGLAEKFVVMYSGNHSPCHPLTTLMEAARRLAGDDRFRFCFVGGGSEHGRVRRFAEEHGLTNILCLPYQPLEKLSGSLSAADLHVVVMGDAYVGIVHPCKVYNILALGSPLLYIGPAESHVTDLRPLNSYGRWFYAATHGEADRLVEHLLTAARSARPSPAEQHALASQFRQEVLMDQVIDAIESVLPAHERPRRRRAAPAAAAAGR